MDIQKRSAGPHGEIAHELNNVLMVLRTYAHFARQPTTASSEHDLTVVAAAAERAGALVD